MGVKKPIAALLTAALLALSMAALASDNVRFITSAYVYADAGFNRADTVIRKGSVAKREEAQDGWSLVWIGKTLGWVRSACLEETADPVCVIYSAAPAASD